VLAPAAGGAGQQRAAELVGLGDPSALPGPAPSVSPSVSPLVSAVVSGGPSDNHAGSRPPGTGIP
jgi:hypothetical protein